MSVNLCGFVWGLKRTLIICNYECLGLPPVQKQEWVYIQKRMMPLFENVCEESTDPVIIDLNNEFLKDFGNGNFWVNISTIFTILSKYYGTLL